VTNTDGPHGEQAFYRRLLRGTTWITIGNLSLRLATFATMVFYARHFGLTQYGYLGILLTTVGMFTQYSGLGLGITSTKYVSEYRVSDPDKAGRILSLSLGLNAALGLALAAVAFGLSDLICEGLFRAPALTTALRWASPMILFASLNSNLHGALGGVEAFGASAGGYAISALLLLLTQIPLTLAYGLNGTALGLTLHGALTFAALGLICRARWAGHGIRLSRPVPSRELRVLLDFSLPAFLCPAVTIVVHWYCVSLLAGTPGGTAEVAAYTAANTYFAIFTFVPSMIGGALLPLLAPGNVSSASSHRVLYRLVTAVSVVYLAVLAIALPLQQELLGVFGPGYRAYGPLIPLVLVYSYLASVDIFLSQALYLRSRLWYLFGVHIGWSTIFVGCTRWLLSEGVYGMAFARGAAYVFLAVAVFVRVALLTGRRAKDTECPLESPRPPA
jgi:O-antigen/teichoic acid export membrane protein